MTEKHDPKPRGHGESRRESWGNIMLLGKQEKSQISNLNSHPKQPEKEQNPKLAEGKKS